MAKKISENKEFSGVIVMENDTTYGEVSDIQVVKNNGLFYLRYKAVLQSVDRENRNHNWYTGDAIVGSLSDPNVTELMSRGKALGEAGHPVDGSVRRIATVDPKFTCHRMMKWWRDDGLIRGELETLDDGMYGTKLTKMILQGMDSSYSFRGFAKMSSDRRHPGVKMVVTPPKYVAYDEVVLPSHPEAYQMRGKTLVQKNYVTGEEKTIAMENAYNQVKYPTGDMSIALTKTVLAEMVRDKSENLDIICESFDLDPSQLLTVDPSGKTASLHTKKERFVFTLESQLAREVAETWKMF